MPATPLHYPIGFGLSKTSKKLSFPGLIVGSAIPDIEVPIMWIFFPSLPDHLLLHSIVGAITLGTLLAVIGTRIFYPTFISFFFGVDKDKLDDACKVTPYLFLSCMLGAIFHLVIDIPMHPFNPVLWPWVDPYDIVGFAVLFFSVGGTIGSGFLIANITFSLVTGFLLIIIILRYKGDKLWEYLWLGED